MTPSRWYHEPIVWLMIGIPTATLIGGLLTLRLALQAGALDEAPEPVRRTAQSQIGDLNPDRNAARQGLSATLSFDSKMQHIELQLGPGTAAKRLELQFVHPLESAEDVTVPLHWSDGRWFGRASPSTALRWRVSLRDPDHGWRLVGRLAAGASTAELAPAVAAP